MSNETTENIQEALASVSLKLADLSNQLRQNHNELDVEWTDVDDVIYFIQKMRGRISELQEKLEPKKVYRVEVTYSVSRDVDVLASNEGDAQEAAIEYADEQLGLGTEWDWYMDNHDTVETFDADDVLYPDVEV